MQPPHPQDQPGRQHEHSRGERQGGLGYKGRRGIGVPAFRGRQALSTATFSPSRGIPSAGTEPGGDLPVYILPAEHQAHAHPHTAQCCPSNQRNGALMPKSRFSRTRSTAPATRNSSCFTAHRKSPPQTTIQSCVRKCAH
jgi:hypothetical protein